MNNLVDKLITIANEKGYVVKFNEYNQKCAPFMYRYSVCDPKTCTILVYHDNEDQKLIVLAHEVGHLIDAEDITNFSYYRNPVYYEERASKWARYFLRKNKYSKIKLASKYYREALKRYKEDLEVQHDIAQT